MGPSHRPLRLRPTRFCILGALILLAALAWTAPVSAQDSDGDGLTNSLETLIGTSPTLADTDSDTVDDWLEFYRCRHPIDASDTGPLRCDLRVGGSATVLDWAWSENGPVAGMHCVHVVGGVDPALWPNTYLCTRPFLGMVWSSDGPLPGIPCMPWQEANDPTWAGQRNYLCFPPGNASPRFITDAFFSNSGTPPQAGCLPITNALKAPGTGWSDNYLCRSDTAINISSAECTNCDLPDLANGALLTVIGRDGFDQTSALSGGSGLSLAGQPCVVDAGTPGQCRLPAGQFLDLGGRLLLQNIFSTVAFEFPAPVLDAVSPTTLPAVGGPLTLSGHYFGLGTPRVRVNGQLCALTAKSQTELRCNAMPGTTGINTVLVEVGNQTSNPRIVSFLPPVPTVSNVHVENLAPTSGGGVLVVLGSNLNQSPQVAFPNGACAITNVSQTRIDCRMPPGVGADVPVTISVAGYSFSGSVDYDPPEVLGFAGSGGPTAGMVPVTLVGNNFGDSQDDVQVSFGSSICSFALVQASVGHTAITCRLPPGQGGAVPVQVNVAGQMSVTRPYRYAAPTLQPIVSRIGTAGGETLHIFGSNFGTSGTVGINGNPCDVGTHGDSEITCTTPPGSGANRTLSVDISGQIATTPISYRIPVLVPASTTSGPTAGGTLLELRGADLGESSLLLPRTVSINQRDCEIQSAGHNLITCRLPEGEGANLPMSIVVDGQTSNTLPFSYLPPTISGLSHATGPTAGGSLLRIYGSQFGLNPTAKVGDVDCDRQGFAPHVSLECTLPPGSSGATQVRVYAGGQPSNAYPFVYDANPIMVLLQKTGSGTGSINSVPAGLDCDVGCLLRDNLYPAGTALTLTATAAPGSKFSGWQGPCTGSSIDCQFNLNVDTVVNAQFQIDDALYASGFED